MIVGVKDFLSTLFPDLTGGFIELRKFVGGMWSKFYPSVDELVNDKDTIDQQAKSGDIFFGVCPRKGHKGDKGAVKSVWALWADLDGKDFTGGKQEALEQLNVFPFPPTIVIDSGNGFHCYWRLKEAIEINGPDDIHKVEVVLKALVRVLNADPQAAEIARVLRLPFMVNNKDPKNPKPVNILELDVNRQYNLSDFEQFIQVNALENTSKGNPIGWIADALLELKDGNRNNTFMRITGRLHRDGWPIDDIIALLTPQAEKCDFPIDELKITVNGVCKRYPNNAFLSSTHNNQETEIESKPFEVITIADFLNGKEEKIDWIVPNILPAQGVAILSGQPGNCKSWMMKDLAIACSSGGKWLDKFETTKSKVLYIDEESSRPLLYTRLKKLLNGTDIQKEFLGISLLIGQGFSLNNPVSIMHLRNQMSIIQPNLVIIDSLIRVNSADENSANEMAKAFAVVKAIVRDFKCCILFSDHQRKGGGGSMDALRGSGEKAAFIDTLLSVVRNEDKTLKVIHSKSRSVMEVPSFLVEVEDMGTEMTRVSYLGEAEAQTQENQTQEMGEFLKLALSHVESTSRQDLVKKAEEVSISQKKLDKALRYFISAGMIERQEQKLTSGRGGKSFTYRWRMDVTPTPVV